MKKLNSYLSIRITIFVAILLFITLTFTSFIIENRAKNEVKNNLKALHNTKIAAGNYLLSFEKPINISNLIREASYMTLGLKHNCETKDISAQDCVVLKTSIKKDFLENNINGEYLNISLFDINGVRILSESKGNVAAAANLTPRPSQNSNFIKSSKSQNTYIGKSKTTNSGNILVAYELFEGSIFVGTFTFIAKQNVFDLISKTSNENINSYIIDETGDVRNGISEVNKNTLANNNILESCKKLNTNIIEYKINNINKFAATTFVDQLGLCVVSEIENTDLINFSNGIFKLNYIFLFFSLLIIYFFINFIIKKLSQTLFKINKKGEDALLGKFDLPENKINLNVQEVSALDKTFDFILHKLNTEHKLDETEDKLHDNILRNEKNIASEALTSKEKFKEAVEAAQDIIVLLSTSGKITYANKALFNLTGFEFSKIEGKAPYETWHTIDETEQFKNAFANVFSKQESVLLSLKSQKANGNVYEAEVRLSPITDTQTGIVSSILLVERDISDEKQKERVKNEFISVVSHELRTPMTIIRGYSALLADGKLGELNAKQTEYMERINVETGRLLDLANDMLDLQKFDAGKSELHLELTDINLVMTELANEFEPLFAKKNLYIKVNNDSQNYKCNLDKRYFNRAITNLIQNALKFTETGGISIHLLNPDETHLVVAVQDTGVGIASDAIPHLFNKFYQASNVLNRKQEGSGLGLSIVKKIVEAHKGLVWVESVEGSGSTFFIALPLS